MKRYMAILGFVFVGVLAGLLVRGIPIVVQVNAGGEELPRGSQNGDVNGDSMLDMSDAVFLLIHLFNGGPEPIACADSDEIWDEVRAIEGEVNGLAGPLNRIACSVELLAQGDCDTRLDRFHWQETGTVVDSCRPLMWADRNFHAQGGAFRDRWTIDQAIEFVNTLEYGGYSDWRMPTVSELMTLRTTGFSGQSSNTWPQFFITKSIDAQRREIGDSMRVFSGFYGPERRTVSVSFERGDSTVIRTSDPESRIQNNSCTADGDQCSEFHSVLPVRDIDPEE